MSDNKTRLKIASKDISWEDAFIVSGFKFTRNGISYSFEDETERNRQFLLKILKHINMSDQYQDIVFTPRETHIDENIWFGAIDKLKHGAECGHYDDLSIMDPYMGGLVRWLNETGIRTGNSCDGHGTHGNMLRLHDNKDIVILNACLMVISGNDCHYIGSSIVRRPPPGTRLNADPVARRALIRDRRWLGDLAKKLYRNRERLASIVSEMKKLKL